MVPKLWKYRLNFENSSSLNPSPKMESEDGGRLKRF
jgi:hypothetical protein